jgi:hypothetical protein
MDKRNHPQYQNLKKKKIVDGTVIHHLREFLKEFLNFGFDNMVRYLEQIVFAIEHRSVDQGSDSTLVFIEFLTFVMESILIMR